jgi:hypothetical protein
MELLKILSHPIYCGIIISLIITLVVYFMKRNNYNNKNNDPKNNDPKQYSLLSLLTYTFVISFVVVAGTFYLYYYFTSSIDYTDISKESVPVSTSSHKYKKYKSHKGGSNTNSNTNSNTSDSIIPEKLSLSTPDSNTNVLNSNILNDLDVKLADFE